MEGRLGLARRPARPIGTITVEIKGSDLPGKRCGPDSDGLWYENIHVGVYRNHESFDRVPGDADSARWAFDIVVKEDEEGISISVVPLSPAPGMSAISV